MRKITILICVLIVIVTMVTTKPLKTSKILVALNCGLREGMTKSDDIKYMSVVILLCRMRNM